MSAAPIYVVVCADDLTPNHRTPGRPQNPIVMETNVNGATMEEAGHRADHMERQGYANLELEAELRAEGLL